MKRYYIQYCSTISYVLFKDWIFLFLNVSMDEWIYAFSIFCWAGAWVGDVRAASVWARNSFASWTTDRHEQIVYDKHAFTSVPSKLNRFLSWRREEHPTQPCRQHKWSNQNIRQGFVHPSSIFPWALSSFTTVFPWSQHGINQPHRQFPISAQGFQIPTFHSWDMFGARVFYSGFDV